MFLNKLSSNFLLSLILLLIGNNLFAQNPTEKIEKTMIDGKIVSMLITDNDTIILANLDEIYITSKSKFANDQEYLLYLRYRSYAAKVYPYAVEAIKIFRAYEDNIKELNYFKRKRETKRLQNAIEKEFEQPLKNLTKGQGKILIKMIERELDTPMYNLISNLKGSFSAMYWNTTSSFFGYKLKHGYIKGEDSILDTVLEDFEVTRSLN